ncbi:MAG: twin-arginine translocase TatA/TatE family subunit [Actinobacteria bacterium]|nr:MAG: twin-arginine translocase TatA/TatE family subunit [Actinomycetota bacterium]
MEWVWILLIVVVLFGPTQIPKLAKMFGKSKKALEEGMKEGAKEAEAEAAAEAKKDAEPADAADEE